MIVLNEGQAPESAIEEFTRTTFPAAAAIEIVPVASGDGSGAPLVPPEAS
jgi:hypothetical protein